MVTYVVRPGDSLWLIARAYGTSVDALMDANGLLTTGIVPGQALLIPVDRHVVQPGESLWTIARRYGVSPQALAGANRIPQPDRIQAGEVLIIPSPPRGRVVNLGFLVPVAPEFDRIDVEEAAPLLTYLAVFEYPISADGAVGDIEDAAAREAAWANGVAPVATISNLTEYGFSEEVVHAILSDRAVRRRAVDDIYRLARAKRFGGVNIDFENVVPEDGPLLNDFLSELRDRLRPAGLHLSMSVHAKTGDAEPPWYAAYDYGAIGALVDHVFLMTYDFHWQGGPPGPIAPLPEVRRVLEYAVDRIQRDKILLGIPFYAYDWTIGSEAPAQALSLQDAVQMAMDRQARIEFDEDARSPYFLYWEDGTAHEVWFEDARSLAGKFDLVREFGLGGLGFWRIGLPAVQAWTLAADRFAAERAPVVAG